MKLLKTAAVLALGLSTFAGAALADRHGGGGVMGGGGGGPHISAGGGGGGGGGPRVSGPRNFNPGPSMKFNKGPSGNFFNKGPSGNFNRPPKHFDGGPKWSGGGEHHHRGHHRGGRFFYTSPLYDNYYDDGYYGSSSCDYYWRRWQATGNPKWKRSYYRCID